MARLRYNGLTATLGADLASGDTTITFAAPLTSSAGAVPTLTSGDTIALSLLDAGGAVAEIVSLTAYTAGATTGTIARAQESTTATAHASGASVVHGPTAADFTSSTVATAFVGAAVEATTARPIASATWTAVQFDAEIYDTDAIYSPTFNTRLTIPAGKAGRWRFTATTKLAGGGAGLRAVAWSKNGTQLDSRFGSDYGMPGPAFFTARNVTIDLNLAAGDYIEHMYYHENGSPMNLQGAYLTCQFLG